MNRTAMRFVPLVVLFHVSAAMAWESVASAASLGDVIEERRAEHVSSKEPGAEAPSPVAEKGERQKHSHRLRGVFFGGGGVLVGIPPAGMLGGGATVEYLVHRHVLVGGCVHGSGFMAPKLVSSTSNPAKGVFEGVLEGLIEAGPLFRLRLPFGESAVAWLMTLETGAGGYISDDPPLLFLAFGMSLIGLEWFFAKRVGLTFETPFHIRVIHKEPPFEDWVPVFGLGLRIGFISSW